MEFIKISKVDKIFMTSPFDSSKYFPGILSLTTSHIIFSNIPESFEFWIEYHVVLNFEQYNLTPKGTPLYIRCKDFRQLIFVFTNEKDCQLCFETLNYFVHPIHIENLFAFNYSPFMKCKSNSNNPGWDLFDPESEYSRMGLPNEYWDFSRINYHFEICETYPRFLVFPKQAINRNIFSESSFFRSKGRLPTLTYININTGSALCRCSQPLRFIAKRSCEDEELIEFIRKCNPFSNFVYVVDLRPVINAIAQRALGKGYENLELYPNVKLRWGHLPNIHTVRESFNGLFDAISRFDFKDSEYFHAISNSEWIVLIKKIMDVSSQCSQALVFEKINVLLHCSDGWDRTSQVASLIQIIVDPFYRTIHGFIILVEKDWISFGHPFSKRCLHIRGESRDYSPIFIQFLDCVWQILRQFPTLFEFNEAFLILLANQVYKCKFGTFISNSYKERIFLELPVRTLSLWDFVNSNILMFRNPHYDQPRSFFSKILPVRLDQRRFKIWSGLYLQFTYIQLHCDNFTESTNNFNIQNEFCTDYIIYLNRELKALELKLLNKYLNLFPNSCNDPIPNLTLYVFHSKYDDGFCKSKFKMKYPDLNYKRHSESIACFCKIFFNRANPRFHCVRCGNIFCSRCLNVLEIYPYSKCKFIVCNDCEHQLTR